MGSIAEKFGITPETLRKWVRRVEVDRGQRPGVTTDEREWLRELERENRALRRTNAILRDASVFLRPNSTVDRGSSVVHRRARWGVEPICRALQFAPQTYYAAKSRLVSARGVRDGELCVAIRRV